MDALVRRRLTKTDWAAATDNAPESNWKTIVEKSCQHFVLYLLVCSQFRIIEVNTWYCLKAQGLAEHTKNGRHGHGQIFWFGESLHNSKGNLLADAITKSNDKLEADILSSTRVHLKRIEKTGTNSGKAGADEKVYLVESKFGENNPADDDEHSCSGISTRNKKAPRGNSSHAETMRGSTWMPLRVGLEPLTD